MARTTGMRRSWQAAVAMTLVVGAPPDGRAGPDNEKPAAVRDAPVVQGGRAATGEDDALYRCGKAHDQVTINLRPGLKLVELAGWAMSFTCKNLVYSGAVGARQMDVTVMAPRPMGPPAQSPGLHRLVRRPPASNMSRRRCL
jgi:hypothetical protein